MSTKNTKKKRKKRVQNQFRRVERFVSCKKTKMLVLRKKKHDCMEEGEK